MTDEALDWIKINGRPMVAPTVYLYRHFVGANIVRPLNLQDVVPTVTVIIIYAYGTFVNVPYDMFI